MADAAIRQIQRHYMQLEGRKTVIDNRMHRIFAVVMR
jgi:hypothetical protein